MLIHIWSKKKEFCYVRWLTFFAIKKGPESLRLSQSFQWKSGFPSELKLESASLELIREVIKIFLGLLVSIHSDGILLMKVKAPMKKFLRRMNELWYKADHLL